MCARELHDLAFALDVQHQQRLQRTQDASPGAVDALHPGKDGGASGPSSSLAYSAGNPPPASAYARRLATQIFEQERRPQLFDTFEFIPQAIYGVVGYCLTTAAAMLYQDVKSLLTKYL